MIRIRYTSTKKSTMSSIVFSLILCLILENLKVFDIMGAALKPIHFILIFASVYCFFLKKQYAIDIITGIIFLFIPVLPIFRINDTREWFKSYMIYFIMCIFMMTTLRHFISEFRNKYDYYIKILMNVVAFAQILGILQFIFMNFFEYFFLRDFFGSFQFHYNAVTQSGGMYRAYSLFHEPSFFALVSNFALAVALFLNSTFFTKRKRIFYIALGIVSVMCTISASGIIVTLALLLSYYLLKSRKPENIIFYGVVAIIVLGFISRFTNILDPLRRISSELSMEGTSGYERIVTPLLYINKVFENYPFFGRGLGQEGNIDAIGIIGRYSSVQNSIFSIITTFGFCSLLYYIPAITYSVRKISENRFNIILLVNIWSVYFATGAWCSPDTLLFLILTITICKRNDENR